MSKKDIYGIKKWGKGFFEISKKGNLSLINPFEKNSSFVFITSNIKYST